MNPQDIPGRHFTFRWEKMPYRIPGQFCDMPAGRLSVKRLAAHSRVFEVRFNNAYIGAEASIGVAIAAAEKYYMEHFL